MHRLYANITPVYIKDLSICTLWYSQGVLEPIPQRYRGTTVRQTITLYNCSYDTLHMIWFLSKWWLLELYNSANLNWWEIRNYSKSKSDIQLLSRNLTGTSLVAQWLRIHLPRQGTRVRALVREDPTCRGATKLTCHNYWACALEPASHNHWAHTPQLLKPACLEPVLRNKRSHCNEKPSSNKE